MRAASTKLEKPLVLLVHGPSLLRLWMERALKNSFRLCVFSRAEEALAFVLSAPKLDVVVTDLSFGSVDAKGTRIARKVKKRFPNAAIFVMAPDDHEDLRLLILRRLKGLRFLSTLGALMIDREVKKALKKTEGLTS